MRKAVCLGFLICLSAAPVAASETETPLARTPSEMTGDEIDAHNRGRSANDAGYIRCRRLEQPGSLVRKLRVCNTNSEWKRVADKGNQDARDSMETLARGWSNSQEPAGTTMPAIRPQ